MIKFFRKFRQKLLPENKFSKYLLYALGEIILVVIGILLALQINDWNNYEKDRAEEQLLLLNIKDEFEKNLKELLSDHAINIKSLETCYYILESDMTTKTMLEIDSLVGSMLTYAAFDPSMGYFNQTIASGKLDLIQNDSLKKYMSQWTAELEDLREDVIIRREYWLNHILPLFRTYIPTRNTDKAQNRPDYFRQKEISPLPGNIEGYTAFVGSLEVDGAIYDHYLNQYYVVITEDALVRYIRQVLELIDSQIIEQ
jgi:hypothetical protein